MEFGTLASIVSILAVLIGGAWALINLWFKQKEKHEDERNQNLKELIVTMREEVKGLQESVGVWRQQVDAQIGRIREEVTELRVVQSQHIDQIKEFGRVMTKIYRHFAGDEEPEQHASEKVRLGKDTFLIRSKKNGPVGGDEGG